MPKHRQNKTKIELVAEIAKASGASQGDCMATLNQFFKVVADALRAGKSIELRSFGTFSPKHRKPRPAWNPRTMKKIMVPERVVPTFKASKELKKAVNP